MRRFDKSCTIEVRWSDEDKAWLATCPQLKPCTTHGPSIMAAVRNLNDMIETMEEDQ